MKRRTHRRKKRDLVHELLKGCEKKPEDAIGENGSSQAANESAVGASSRYHISFHRGRKTRLRRSRLLAAQRGKPPRNLSLSAAAAWKASRVRARGHESRLP